MSEYGLFNTYEMRWTKQDVQTLLKAFILCFSQVYGEWIHEDECRFLLSPERLDPFEVGAVGGCKTPKVSAGN